MASCWWSSMTFLKTIAFLFGACFLVGLLVEIGGTSATLPETVPELTLRSSKHFLVRARGSTTKFQKNSHPIYVSKRRVPNGPDPIHNRRAGKSGRPAGRA